MDLDLPKVTIGIVTALPVEGAAIRAVVEAPHQVTIPGDPTHYHVGWLPSSDPNRPHGVVVTILPQDGTRNASAVTVDLIRSFPTVRCVIMCGIAGGVPAPYAPDRHVRLGDVVVASEGIVDYDHVRTVDGQDHLRRPTEGMSQELLRAMREVQVGETLGERPWERWLETGRSPVLKAFRRPADSTDIVYQGATVVRHPSRRASGHVRGKPRVHYGAIGSADRLLRDEVKRDEIAARYQIRAVEMEASGIAAGTTLHSIHWFVVRGVADYCDNMGKNDRWHPYSSLAAAAYVRALLEKCYPFPFKEGRWPSLTTRIVQIPSRRRTFTGREGLIGEIERCLRESETGGLRAVTLFGLGGLGKTEVAVEYAYRHLDDFDVVAMIPAIHTASIISSLCSLASRLGVPDSESKEEMIAGLWAKLGERLRWLLIFDDADNQHELRGYWPRVGHGQVMITSRNRFWDELAIPIEVTVFSRAEAISFVNTRTKRDDRETAGALAQALGDLPLALEQAAAYIDETATSVDTYVRLFNTRTQVVLETRALSSTSVSVASTWLVSLERLQVEAPVAEQILSLLAYLGPTKLQRSLLQGAVLMSDGVSKPDPLQFNSAIAALGRYSLASVTEDAIGVHVLVQHVIRATLALSERLTWAAKAVRLVDQGLPSSTDDVRDWAVFDALLPHALTVTGHEESVQTEPTTTARVLFKAARYVRLLGDLQEAKELLMRSNAICGEAGPQAGENLIELGDVQRGLDQLADALQSFQRSRDIWKAELGDRSLREARALIGIGTLHFDFGHGVIARRAVEESLSILRSRPEADRLDIAHALSILGLVLWGLLNDYTGAIAAHRESLAIRESVLGPDHPQVATSLDNLGKALLSAGAPAEALRVTGRALAIRKARLGGAHPSTALTLNHIGDILCEKGDTSEARAAHEQARVIFMDRLGSGHSHVARSHEGLGQDSLRSGDLAAAEHHFGEALKIWEKAVGPEDWGAGEILISLGQVKAARGDEAGASGAYTRALKILTGPNGLSEDHREVVRLRNLLDALKEG